MDKLDTPLDDIIKRNKKEKKFQKKGDQPLNKGKFGKKFVGPIRDNKGKVIKSFNFYILIYQKLGKQ